MKLLKIFHQRVQYKNVKLFHQVTLEEVFLLRGDLAHCNVCQFLRQPWENYCARQQQQLMGHKLTNHGAWKIKVITKCV